MATIKRIIVESPRRFANEIIVRQATPDEVMRGDGITKSMAREMIIDAYLAAGWVRGSHGYVRGMSGGIVSIDVRGVGGNYSPLQALKFL